MKLRGCSQQAELAAAVRSGQWPDGCDPALRAHAAECRSCGDFVLVAQTFQQARTEAARQATLGSPGSLWWSAQVRRRNRAVERMALPIVIAEVTALIGACAALAFSLWRWNQVTNWLHSITGVFVWQADMSSTSGWMMLLSIAASLMLLLLGSVAVYLTASKD